MFLSPYVLLKICVKFDFENLFNVIFDVFWEVWRTFLGGTYCSRSALGEQMWKNRSKTNSKKKVLGGRGRLWQTQGRNLANFGCRHEVGKENTHCRTKRWTEHSLPNKNGTTSALEAASQHMPNRTLNKTCLAKQNTEQNKLARTKRQTKHTPPFKHRTKHRTKSPWKNSLEQNTEQTFTRTPNTEHRTAFTEHRTKHPNKTAVHRTPNTVQCQPWLLPRAKIRILLEI